MKQMKMKKKLNRKRHTLIAFTWEYVGHTRRVLSLSLSLSYVNNNMCMRNEQQTKHKHKPRKWGGKRERETIILYNLVLWLVKPSVYPFNFELELLLLLD